MRASHWIPVFLTFVVAALPTLALEHGSYTVEVLVDGVPLQEHAARAKTYVEASAGCEYSIRLRNRSSERIAVAVSVDGLNTIDARTTTAREASKWILAPHQTITLDGWQTSSSTARRFYFTNEVESYGAWLGNTANLGVISVAVFREKVPDPPAPILSPRSRESRSSSRKSAAPESGLSDDLAATGIGRQLDHHVRRVRFESEDSPTAVMQLRYEYHDALVRLGVLPRPYAGDQRRLELREGAHGFEGLEFAPDPFR